MVDFLKHLETFEKQYAHVKLGENSSQMFGETMKNPWNKPKHTTRAMFMWHLYVTLKYKSVPQFHNSMFVQSLDFDKSY